MVGRWVVCFGIGFLAPLLLGMGMFGQPAAREEVPETDKRFDVILEDLDGTVVRVTHVSYDGELYLPVFRGKGLITIPFEKIHKIEMGQKQGSRRQAKVTFNDGSSETFWVEENVLIIGKVPYGTYQIQAKDIRTLEFVQPGSSD